MILAFMKTMLITIAGIGTVCICSILVGITALVVIGIILILRELFKTEGD